MKKLVLVPGILLTMFFSGSPASTLPPAGSLRDAPAGQSLVEKVQSCSPGWYWCPGEIEGCCRNGWGCGSTHCINPGAMQSRRADEQRARRRAAEQARRDAQQRRAEQQRRAAEQRQAAEQARRQAEQRRADAPVTYNRRSPGCYRDYLGKCVTANLNQCKNGYGTVPGCSGQGTTIEIIQCQDAVLRGHRECSGKTCDFARACANQLESGGICATMPVPRPTYPRCGNVRLP